jgi:hypothetical protein
MAYTKYSLTPADNNAAPPNGAPEGMLPSGVNDTMRDMMSQIRDVGDGIRGGTYTMTAPVITGGSVTGSTINNSAIGGTTPTTAAFTTANVTKLTDSQGGVLAPISSVMRNRIINGAMTVAQRGTSFTSGTNNNDAYVLDRFYILSDGNDAIDVTQTTTVPTGAKFSIGLDVETTNKKFGIAQIIENANCFDAIGGQVTLSFQAKVSSTAKLDNVKCAIVAWSGTADTVTSDIISAWGAEGTNPTLIANATYENSPANLNVTTSFATYSVTANVDTASTSNIIVFIWSDVTDTTAGDFLYITNVQLEKGTQATGFEYRQYQQELALCQRYYAKSFLQGTAPAQNVGSFSGAAGIISVDPLVRVLMDVCLPVVMRAAPTVTFFNPSAANAEARDASASTDCSSTSTFAVGDRNFVISTIGSASSTQGNGLSVHWTAAIEL